MPSALPRIVIYAEPTLNAALAGDANRHGRDLSDHVLRILEEYAVEKGLLMEDVADEYRLRWSLIDRAAETAANICRDGRFDDHLNRNTFTECMADPVYAADYERYLGGNPYAHGNPRKAINKEIGKAIKARVGAEVRRNEDGTPVKVNVSGAVIQSYTLMASFDPERVR